MLLLRNKIYLTVICFALALCFNANAKLYGFQKNISHTDTNNILQMKYLPQNIPNYRALMRDNLLMLIDYAKSHNSDFQIVTHEGQSLLTKSKWEHDLEIYNQIRLNHSGINDHYFLSNSDSIPVEPPLNSNALRYLQSVDAVVINNLYCGKGQENDITINHNLGHISIDQCSNQEEIDSAIMRSLLDNKIIYAFSENQEPFQDLSSQPMINDSATNIYQVSDAKNISFLLDDTQYDTPEQMINAISLSNYDIIIINPLFRNEYPFSSDDIKRMQIKRNGGKRLIIALINVSEISTSDYFWKPHWQKNNPSWFAHQSFVNPKGFITRYWHKEWQQLLSKHFKDIVRSGYNGAFFTGIENHQYFEQLTPLE